MLLSALEIIEKIKDDYKIIISKFANNMQCVK
jgi:hypothetical protein